MKVDWKEVTFANSTIGLRRGDYDLYGSSLTYTIARALTVNYVGPLWSKGSLLLIHKDNAGKLKTAADVNDPSVRVSVTAGASEEGRIPVLWPKAKVVTTTGQVTLGAEPVRAKKAEVWMSGDSDVLLFAKRNSWSAVIEPGEADRQAPEHLGGALRRPGVEAVLRHVGDVPHRERRDGAALQAPYGEARRA